MQETTVPVAGCVLRHWVQQMRPATAPGAPVDLKGIGQRAALEALAEDQLEHVAGLDVLAHHLHRLAELRLRHVAAARRPGRLGQRQLGLRAAWAVLGWMVCGCLAAECWLHCDGLAL